ncbi:MAG: hypothetical protein NWF06_03565 [Candidatus Bathyarchaeota archaeon]|nr:hypothetical protein [Candidatus Bathyarchaeum sp.]
MNFPFPTVWRLIDNFKEQCRLTGWETCETEDWIKTEDNKYHSFLWTQTIHPSTFEKIAKNRKCGIRRGNSYEVVNISYTGWLFQERPPEFLISWIKENTELSQKNAIFDLSCMYTGKNICRKINETKSSVFKEFEHFLEEGWNIEFKHADELPTLTT